MYKWRHLIENFFCKLKEFKRIALRADKTDQSFAAMIYIAAAVINSRSIPIGPRPVAHGLQRHCALPLCTCRHSYFHTSVLPGVQPSQPLCITNHRTLLANSPDWLKAAPMRENLLAS